MKITLNDVSLLLLSHGIQALSASKPPKNIQMELKYLKRQVTGQRAFINVNTTQSEFVRNILDSCIKEIQGMPMADQRVLGLTKDEVLDKLNEDIQKL